MSSIQEHKQIQSLLLRWHKSVDRHMPWKDTKDPYKIWVSEVILQQTQFSQGKLHYLRFVERYPDVFALAKSTLDDVLLAWQGIGYNTRARNIHRAAKIVVEDYEGKLPESPDLLEKLPGIGNYTAAAIASFAFDKPVIAIDTNVKRWVSRYFTLETNLQSGKSQKSVEKLLYQIFDGTTTKSSVFNQASIDLGALICKSRLPKCIECPLNSGCLAYLSQSVSEYPKKALKRKRKERHFNYIILEYDGEYLIKKRKAKDIWQELYEFYLIENVKLPKQIHELNCNTNEFVLFNESSLKQTLTHQIILGRFFYYKLKSKPEIDGVWVKKENLRNYALPGIIVLFLDKYLSNFTF